MDAKSYESFTFVLLALVKKAQHHQEEQLQHGDLELSPEQFERAKRYQQKKSLVPKGTKSIFDQSSLFKLNICT